MAGGPCSNITINGRIFPLDGENNVSIQLSGFKNEVKPNGDGKSSRQVKTPVPGLLENVPVIIDPARQDLEFLRDVANSSNFVDVDITKVDGTVYSGNMQIIDDIKESAKESTCELKLSGTLEQQ